MHAIEAKVHRLQQQNVTQVRILGLHFSYLNSEYYFCCSFAFCF